MSRGTGVVEVGLYIKKNDRSHFAGVIAGATKCSIRAVECLADTTHKYTNNNKSNQEMTERIQFNNPE